jgi:iron complex outermembrane receptor protein
MSILQVDRTRASLAAAISLILASAQANAQDVSKLEEVVVTGTFIRGTPEDSAMPVEVVTFEELQNMGRPSNLDLIKTMSESGSVAGDINRANFYPIGAQTINLRSLGPRFTTVVFNGRRFPEQYSVNTGRFNNVAWIPNAAIGSVETLKAGGAATYGADAVAGVVNYVTRKGFKGLELNVDYRYIDDSDGDYNADILWGHDFGAVGELLVSLGYQHRSALRSIDRKWSQYHFLENPNSWHSLTSGISNPGTMVFQRPVAGTQVSFTPTQVPTSQLHMSAGGSIRDVGCSELGGFPGWTNTPTPACFTNVAETEELVTEQDSFTLYLEHNVEVGGLRFHTEGLVFRQEIPNIALAGTFVNNPASWPLEPIAGQADPYAGSRTQQITGTSAFYVPGDHPAVVNLLMNDLLNADGSRAFTDAQIAAITNPANPGRVGLLNFLWKPFGNGGSPLGDVDRQKGYLTMWRITEAIGGDLPEFWGTKLEWEIGLTYSYTKDLKKAEDILVQDLQAALNGYGGPNCNGIRAGLPGSTCQWFNPFSSAIERNVFTGARNPYYEPSLANTRELVDWLYQPIWFEREYKNYAVDPIIRGDLGIQLPGGPVAIAIGGQWRRQDERVTLDDISNRNNNPCPILGVQNCAETSQLGPWVYNRQGNAFGAAAHDYRPDARHYPVVAAFLETQLPILPSLTVNLAGRYERFYSDVTDRDNEVVVPGVSLKWQPLNWLGTRVSWGKTFSQVNPPEERAPEFANSTGSTRYTGLGSGTRPDNGLPATYETWNYPNVDIKPEKGEFFTVGFLFNAGGFSANVDYYDLRIHDYTRTMTVANVLETLALDRTEGPRPAGNVLMNCDSPALTQGIRALEGRPLVELANPCVQGQYGPDGSIAVPGTTMLDLASGRVNYFAGLGQTNSGTLKTSGIDLSMRYRFDVGPGTITPSIDLSRVLKWELGDFVIGGVTVARGYDGLGYVNLSTGRIGQPVAKYRGTAGLLFNFGRHMVNIMANYVPKIINEDETLFAPASNKNANIGDANGFTPSGGAECLSQPQPVADLGNVPPGTGTGQFANGTVPAGQVGAGTRGFCANQNAYTLAGQSIDEWLNIDLVYRVQLPWETSATLTIQNVLDRDPSFFRASVPYNTGYGSPLGRTFKLGVSKRF